MHAYNRGTVTIEQDQTIVFSPHGHCLMLLLLFVVFKVNFSASVKHPTRTNGELENSYSNSLCERALVCLCT